MIKAILFDFSRVLLNAKDPQYGDSLNALHKRLLPTENYNPLDHFVWNQPLIDLALRLKETYPLYIYTTGTIQNDPHFRPLLDAIFQDIFTVEGINYAKDNKQAYAMIANNINLEPQEILFIDDTSKNILAAKEAGMQTIHFTSNEQTIKDITSATNVY